MADKAGLTYGRVTGRFEALVADSAADAGENPDVLPLSGTVTFTPLVGPVKLLGTPNPSVMVPTAIQGTIDADGDISLNGVKGLYLVATDGPTSPTGWIYRVQFDLNLGGVPVPVDTVQIAVPGGTTQDITSLLPVSGGGAVVPQPLTVPQQVYVGGSQPSVVGPAFWYKEVGTGLYELWVQTLGSSFAPALLDTSVPTVARTDITGAQTITQAQGRSAWLNRRLTGNTDLTIAAGVAGQAYSLTLDITQDTAGSRTLRLLNVATEDGIVLPISTAANSRTLVYLVWNGFVWTATLGGRNFSIPASWVA